MLEVKLSSRIPTNHASLPLSGPVEPIKLIAKICNSCVKPFCRCLRHGLSQFIACHIQLDANAISERVEFQIEKILNVFVPSRVKTVKQRRMFRFSLFFFPIFIKTKKIVDMSSQLV